MKKLKIFSICLFVAVCFLASGCQAVKAVGNFFTGTAKEAVKATEEVISSTTKGIPIQVEHNFNLEPMIVWAIIAVALVLVARFLIKKYVYRKKITKK